MKTIRCYILALSCIFMLCASSLVAQDNLIEGTLEPVGGSLSSMIRLDGVFEKTAEQVKVEGDAYVIDNEAAKEVGDITFRSQSLPELEADARYLFSMEANVEGMEPSSTAGGGGVPFGLMFYFHSANSGEHRWALITGDGATDEWVKMVIPIDTEGKPELCHGFMMLTLTQARAKVRFRNFRLEKTEEILRPNPYFILKDGREISNNIYRLE